MIKAAVKIGVQTIFGKKRRPFNHKSTASAPEVRIETPDYNMTIFKIHFGRLTVKLYDKGERTLRAEVVVHNTKDLKCKRGIDSFGEIVEKLATIMCSFLSNLDYAHVATIDQGSFEEMAKPTQAGKNRLAGINFNNKRIKLVATALVHLSMKPGGFSSLDLANQINGKLDAQYSNRNASYDIKKFRGKGIVKKIPGSIRYEITPNGISNLVAILSMLTKEIPAVITTVNNILVNKHKDILLDIDKHLLNIQQESECIRRLQNIILAA